MKSSLIATMTQWLTENAKRQARVQACRDGGRATAVLPTDTK